jgi:hypothetical protein
VAQFTLYWRDEGDLRSAFWQVWKNQPGPVNLKSRVLELTDFKLTGKLDFTKINLISV